MIETNLLTLCGFDPGGDGVWRRSSSEELEFLGKYVVNITSLIAGQICHQYHNRHYLNVNISTSTIIIIK